MNSVAGAANAAGRTHANPLGTPEVASQMGRVEDVISHTEGLVKQLTERLESVLVPMPDAPLAVSAVEGLPQTRHANSLYQVRARVDATNRELQRLLDAVAVPN